MNYNTLLKLAGINDESEIMAELGLSDDAIVDSEFSAVLKEMQEEDRKKAMKNAAKEVIDLLKHTKSSTDQLVAEIRCVRHHEKKLLGDVKRIQLAREYAAETSNYLPLLVALQYDSPRSQASLQADFGEKAFVPGNWKPASAKPATRSATKK